MTRRIALLGAGVDRETTAQLRTACQAMHYELSAAGQGEPAALVAGLPAGERTVPVEAAEQLAAAPSAVPLVLLCNEALVREHVVLEGGRLHLVAPPHDAQRLQWRLEHIVAGRPPATSDTRPYRSSHSRLVERWSPDYWNCVISTAATGADEIGRLLLVEKRPDGCFSIFPSEASRKQPAGLIELFERLLLGDDRSMCQWLADLSGKGALLAYDSETRELVADLPPTDECAAFLLSPQRLPNISPLPSGRTICIPAAPGDILLAAVGTSALQALDIDCMRGIVRAGGVLGARELQQRLADMPNSNALLLLEARA
jgi:hypothetical protein